MNTLNLVRPPIHWIPFKSKVSVFYQTDQYVLKTAECTEELELALRLRHQVFYQELQNKKRLFGMDIDRLDFKCDHLLIIDKTTEAVVGCYRLMSSHFIKRFYSESEFDLTSLTKANGVKLELGRACILPEHRNGTVIQLLWRGITAYMRKTDTRFLLGCSSVQTIDPLLIASYIRKIWIEGLVDQSFQITPTLPYHPFNHGVDNQTFTAATLSDISLDLPPLIQAYVKAGAKLAALPAVDKDFGCIDFFTILDREKMHPLFLRRYFDQ